MLVMLALPWLWPYTAGPTPNALPLMVSWACGFVVVGLWALGFTQGMRLAELLARAWLAAALLSCLIALAQWFGLGQAWFFISAADAGRAYANLRQPNQFASLTSLGLAAVLWFASRGASAWWLSFATVLLAMGNAVSASRTGLVQWLVLALLAAWWPQARVQRLRLCILGLLAYAMAAALLPLLLRQVRGIDLHSAFFRMGQDLGCSSRKLLWSNVLELIAQRPWAGWGWGELDYAHYVHLYAGPRFCDILDNAHNLPLHLAVELGIPIAGALLVAIAVWGWRQRPWSEDAPGRQLAWCAVAVIGLHSLLEYPLWYGPFQLALLGSLVLLTRGVWGPRARAAGAGFAGVGVLVLVLFYAQYDAVSQAYLPAPQRRPAFREDPIAAAERVLFFRSQLCFAQLSITPLTIANAAQVHALAGQMLHFSPEPRVIEKRIESAVILGDEADALWHAARYRAAFSEDHARWRAAMATPLRSTLSTIVSRTPEPRRLGSRERFGPDTRHGASANHVASRPAGRPRAARPTVDRPVRLAN